MADTWQAAERTFTSALDLIERFEELHFGHSTPALYAWLEQNRPTLFARLQQAVAAGRFEPLNGPWVESDCVLISGASLLRQFQLGQQYSSATFPGLEHPLAWLPDSFGFAAGVPAVAHATGVRWFCTHKLAWNATNPFPHRLFRWRSRCGSELLALINAPIGTDGDPVAMERYRLAWQGATGVDSALWLPGVGDHGGGPSAEMLEQLRLWQQQAEAAPQHHGSLRDYLAALEPLAPRLPVWRDELYLELHRGCATSRPDQKRHNRTLERLLREAELAQALAGEPETVDWRTLLFQQFHDILPGTAIAWVYKEVENRHAEITRELLEIINTSLAALANDPTANTAPQALTANAMSVSRNGVAGLGVAVPSKLARATSIVEQKEFVILENEELRVRVDRSGRIVSLFSLTTNREAIAPGIAANELHLHNDNPTRWDAWDIDEHYRNSKQVLDTVDEFNLRQDADGAAVIETKRAEAIGQFDLFGGDSISQVAGLDIEIPATEWDKSTLLSFEREMLGLYVSDHPLLGVEHILRSNTDMSISALVDDGGVHDGFVTIGGLITGISRKVSRTGSSWAIVTVEDLEGSLEVLFFAKTYTQYALTLVEDRIVTIRGRVDRRDEQVRFSAVDMTSLDVSSGPVGPLLISLPISQCTPPIVERVKEILRSHPGKREVHLHIEDSDKSTTMKIDALVTSSPSLSADLKSILGPDCLVRS